MRQIVFDIETSAVDLCTLNDSQREIIFRYAEMESDSYLKEKKLFEAERYMASYPFTAKIIALSIYDITKDKYLTYYLDTNSDEWSSNKGNALYRSVSEAEMLTSFWKILQQVDQIITFNGKSFDLPFIITRSAMLKIRPSKNFLTNRYEKDLHLDLLDALTFFGQSKKFNLDFYCSAFNIKSPKSNELNGMEVKNYSEAKRIKEIAQYCKDDVRAAFELYQIWNSYINVKNH